MLCLGLGLNASTKVGAVAPVQAGLFYEIKLIMSTDLFITCTSVQTHHFKNMLGRTSALLLFIVLFCLHQHFYQQLAKLLLA